MENFNHHYSNNERKELAKEAISLMELYRKYKNESNYIEEINTYQRIGIAIIKLTYSVLDITKVRKDYDRNFCFEDFGVEECIQDTSIFVIEKIEKDEIDTTDYDMYPEKFIKYVMVILQGKLLNLRKKINRENSRMISIDEPQKDGKFIDIEDRNYNKEDELFSDELFSKLRNILDELRETDKDGKYIDYLFGDKKIKKKEIAEAMGVSDSLVSRKEKRLQQKISQRLLEVSEDLN